MTLNPNRPAELVAALRHNNMFWRMTAQRLLVERGRPDVIDELYRIITDPAVDAVGLNSPAVHAIWTLHGLGVLNGSNAAAERIVRGALRHPAAGVRKNALMALPRNAATLDAIRQAQSLTDPDENVRLHAFLALADYPASDELGRTAFQLGKDTTLLRDEWLPTALFLAAVQHQDGFLGAYAEEIGAVEFARVAGRALRGELENAVDMSGPALNDRNWPTLPVPASWANTPLANFAGIVWFRHEFQLPANADRTAATLSLGPIRDGDVTYLNGVRIGATTNAANATRKYEVPAGLLRVGRNVIAVQVTHRRGTGGIFGERDSLFLAGVGLRTPLAGDWKYRIIEEWQGGRQPDFSTGTPFEQQFLKYYNPVAGPRGVPPSTGRGGGAGRGGGPAPDVTLALSVVPGQNQFDQTTITVRPGQRVAIAFDNIDDMPHNVVVLQRTVNLDAAGSLLNDFVARPGAAAAFFVPPDLPVVAVGPIVNPRETNTLVFTAPTEPGTYPFICTFPGHWMTMRGVLRVAP